LCIPITDNHPHPDTRGPKDPYLKGCARTTNMRGSPAENLPPLTGMGAGTRPKTRDNDESPLT